MLANVTEYELIVPPKEILGKKKQAGDVDAIWSWFKENIRDCSDAIISIDTLLFSGIVPSRLHYSSAKDLLIRLERLRGLKAALPELNLYAFNFLLLPLVLLRVPGDSPPFFFCKP